MNISELEELLADAKIQLAFYDRPDKMSHFEENIGYYKGVIATLEMVIRNLK